MSVRRILQIGDPQLRLCAAPVDVADVDRQEIRTLVGDLIDTMRDAGGAGLAATQIGVPLRVATLEVRDNPRYPYKPNIPLTVAINPVVESVDDEVILINEGCLSIPLRGDVPRHANVRVRYLDPDGVEHERTAHGLTAGTWQHEVDHLDGVLLVDRADSRSLATWEEFEHHQKDVFLKRVRPYLDSSFLERAR